MDILWDDVNFFGTLLQYKSCCYSAHWDEVW